MSAANSQCALCTAAATRRVSGYGIAVCPRCWADAADGWPAAAEPALMPGLAAAGLFVPDRNSAGRLPREYTPPADFPI